MMRQRTQQDPRKEAVELGVAQTRGERPTASPLQTTAVGSNGQVNNAAGSWQDRPTPHRQTGH